MKNKTYNEQWTFYGRITSRAIFLQSGLASLITQSQLLSPAIFVRETIAISGAEASVTDRATEKGLRPAFHCEKVSNDKSSKSAECRLYFQ